jgi:predicted DNA-binding transcriptional regulator AlpA
MPKPRTLLTAADIAELLGVSRSRVKQLAQQSDFPKPYAVSPTTDTRRGIRLWRPDDIERWMPTWNRSTGPIPRERQAA